MPTYREFLLQTSANAQDFTFNQALRWMDAFEGYSQRKAEPRSKKKRSSRLRKTLSELQQPVPARYQKSPYAAFQPIFCNPSIEAALPNESSSYANGPLYATYRDSVFDSSIISASACQSWGKYRLMNSTSVNEVYFSAISPRQPKNNRLSGRAEFETQAIQLTEIYTRMLCSESLQKREYALSFERPRRYVDYSDISLAELSLRDFIPDATYMRDGQQIAVLLPCGYWWDGEEAFHQFIVWLVEQCDAHQLCYEIWQPGLIRNLRTKSSHISL